MRRISVVEQLASDSGVAILFGSGSAGLGEG
jgi:hypothetical protein